MKHFRHILIGTLLLLTSCIENSIPYPVVTLQILGVEGEGFTCSPEDINTQERIVTLHLDEQTDISNVKIDKISVTENARVLRNPFRGHSTCGLRSTSPFRFIRITNGRS